MKSWIGVIITIVLLAIAAYVIWDKMSHPVDATVNAALQAGVLQGTVVNNGARTIDSAVIHATFRDKGGAAIGDGTAEFQSLQPGQSLPFRIPGPPGAASETHELKAKSGGL